MVIAHVDERIDLMPNKHHTSCDSESLRLLALVRVFHDGLNDVEIANLYFEKIKDSNDTDKIENARWAIEAINNMRLG